MDPMAELLGESVGMRAVREKLRRLLERQQDARRLPPVLIEGETGTGKGLLARSMHRAGPRPDGPFVDVNCAAIPETLLEAEMFGFERGAFTDARRAKPGLFQAAHRGTIFLDEVGLLPEPLQAKLLKVLEERVVRRLGATRDEPVDVWIVTATNEDLRAAVRERRFREDLYHRLAVLTLTLPPLRERGEDVLRLAEHFLRRACADYGVTPKTLDAGARAALMAYAWPGNVRELGNLMERVALLSPEPEVSGPMLGLPEAVLETEPEPARADKASSLDDAVRDRVAEALRQTNWNISRTAALLGISRNTLRARIEKYGLRVEAVATRPKLQRGVTPSATASSAGPPAAVVSAPPLLFRWDRRRVSLLRAALIGPSGLEEPLETSRILGRLIEKVASFGGRLEGVGQSGLIAVFGIQSAEDAPSRAAHTAMALLKAVERARHEGGARVEIKVGIHVAQVLVGYEGASTELDLEAKQTLWPLLNELAGRAAPGTILVSEAAASFLKRRFEIATGPGGERLPEKAYLLAGAERTGLGPGGRLAKFVGRTHELELLRQRLESAMRGQGQVVGVGGDAGIGKSRLLYEFRQGLAERPGIYLEAQCHSYARGTPYLPVLDLLRAFCGITEADLPEVVAEKLRLGLDAAGMRQEQSAPYLLQSLGVKEGAESLAALSPEAIKGRTFDTLRQMILRRSRRSPLILVVEDLHWIDRTSEEFLASLAETVAGAPIMLVCTYRSGYRPPWIEKSYATQISLQALAPEDCLSVMQSVLGTHAIAPALARLVLTKAEGNPFFIEELALAARERDDLVPSLGVPETIQDVLLARIERLPDSARRLLQAASILGRQVSLLLLRAIWDSPEPFEDDLNELIRLEFLYEESGADEPVYVFKHALTQEVAYESLDATRRQSLHEVAGHALEALYANRLEEACDRLAYHYGRTKDHERAVRYLTMAAHRSGRSYAHIEAVEALRAARSRLERVPATAERERQIADLVLSEAHSLHLLGRFEDTRDLLLRHEERVEQLGDPTWAGPFYFWLGRTHSLLGDHERTGAAVRRAVEIARACGDTATLGKAHFMLAYEDYWSGRPLQGVGHGREAIALLERTEERWWLGMAHWVAALNCIPLGDFEAGREATERANAIGEAMGDSRLQNYAAWTRGWIDATRGEWELGLEACRQALDRSQDPVNTAYATGQLGYAYLEGGDVARAIPLLERAVDQWTRFHVRQTPARFMASLSEAYLASDQLERAERLATEALELSRSVKFLYAVGLAQRVAGKVAQARGDLSGAGRWLEEAVETFRVMDARFELAQTLVASAELAHARRDLPTAARHLREAAKAFQTLGVPRRAGRVAQLARTWSVDL